MPAKFILFDNHADFHNCLLARQPDIYCAAQLFAHWKKSRAKNRGKNCEKITEKIAEKIGEKSRKKSQEKLYLSSGIAIQGW
jgi:hypothetical protein